MSSTAPQSITKKWLLSPADTEAGRTLSRELGLHPLVATLLINRKVTTVEEARNFLSPKLAHMPDPYTMLGMDTAVSRILVALERDECICVWGDYDVDGVTSASQLVWFFRAIGKEIRTFVPDRFKDGYGLNGDRIRELAQDGVDLFITVDCGITSVAEVEIAREEGAEVIIVDHHQVPPEKPKAFAILDPHQKDCAYPDKRLAACGVTWVLLIALRQRLRKEGYFATSAEPDLRQWLDLTAIGTVADMVPLHGLNRAIVKHGLPLVAQGTRPGVGALCQVAQLSPDRLTAGRIGFHIGPRINAAGRIAHASAGLQLLTTEDEEVATATAREVDRYNQDRRAIQNRIVEEATHLALDLFSKGDPRVIVLARPDWHPGVLGIVATRLVEKFYRPTILLAISDGVAQGSARSISGFRLVEHLRNVEELLTKYGGHDHAAGLTLPVSTLPAFIEAMNAEGHQALSEDMLIPVLKCDAECPIREVDFSLVQRLRALEPYGQGNREPSLLARAVQVTGVRKVGADQTHLKLNLEDAGIRHDAIAFGMAELAPKSGDRIDIVYVPEINRFRNQDRLQLRIKDFRPTEAP